MIKIEILKSLDLKALSDKRIQQFRGNEPKCNAKENASNLYAMQRNKTC